MRSTQFRQEKSARDLYHRPRGRDAWVKLAPAPLAVVVCDIDYFKTVNDRQGHSIGDDILRQFVARTAWGLRYDRGPQERKTK